VISGVFDFIKNYHSNSQLFGFLGGLSFERHIATDGDPDARVGGCPVLDGADVFIRSIDERFVTVRDFRLVRLDDWFVHIGLFQLDDFRYRWRRQYV